MTGTLTADTEYKSGCVTAKLRGEIDHHTAKGARDTIDKAIYLYRPKKLVLSLAEVTFMDSSGLGLILGRIATAEAVSASVTLRDVPPHAMKILSMAGVNRIPDLVIEEKENK